MGLLHTSVGSSLLLAALTACAGGSTPSLGPPSQAIALRVPHQTTARAPSAKHAGSTLYVLNTDGGHAFSVSVYAGAKGSFLRSIALAGVVDGALAADPAGHLYASGGPDSVGQVNIYSRRGAKLVQTVVGPHRFDLLTLDAFGNLYTLCSGKLVCEYGPSKAHVLKPRPIRKIGFGKLGVAPDSLAVDPSGDLAVSSNDEALVFAPGQVAPYWEVGGPGLFFGPVIFDASGNLFASVSDSVAVYPPGGTTPIRTITNGIVDPVGLAFDGQGNLFVLNYGILSRGVCVTPPSVTVYPPGASTPVRTITDGLACDEAHWIAVDDSGRLYVANGGRGSSVLGNVVVYAAGKSTPTLTITQGIANPFALTVGP